MKKGLSLAFLMMSLIIIIIVFQVEVSKATTSWNGNATHNKASCGGAGIDDACLNSNNHWEEEDEDAELPFSLNSHVGSRMLLDLSGAVTGKTGNAPSPAVPCQQSTGFRTCLPLKNPGGPRPPCQIDAYNREC